MQYKINGGEDLLGTSPLAAIQALQLHFSGAGAGRRAGTLAMRVASMTALGTLATLGAVVIGSYLAIELMHAKASLEQAIVFGCSMPADIAAKFRSAAIDLGSIALQTALAVAVALAIAPITAPAARAARSQRQ